MNKPTFSEKQLEILRLFEEIGIKGEIGTPHLQRNNAQLIIPKAPLKKQILK